MPYVSALEGWSQQGAIQIQAPCQEHTSEAIKYGTHSQGISQFYLHTPRSSANGKWTIPTFVFPAKAGTHLLTLEGWKAELALDSWLVTYRNKCRAPGIEPGHGCPSQY